MLIFRLERVTDTMGRIHSDAQFAGSSSVPAHVEMMGFLGIGNNPMVGCTVACAADVISDLIGDLNCRSFCIRLTSDLVISFAGAQAARRLRPAAASREIFLSDRPSSKCRNNCRTPHPARPMRRPVSEGAQSQTDSHNCTPL